MVDYDWTPTDGLLASEEHNWQPNGVPGPADSVVFEDAHSASNCTWDIPEINNMYVGAVTAYTGTVTISVPSIFHVLFSSSLPPGTACGHIIQDAQMTCQRIIHNSGSWAMNADVLIKDLATEGGLPYPYHILFGGSEIIFTNNGTAASPRVIRSVNTTATYPIHVLIAPATPPYVRTFDFDYLEFRNLAPSIGNTTTWLFFNTGDVTNEGILENPSPLRRDQKIDEVYCEGRSYSRIYPEGGHAGIVELSGLVPWVGYTWQKLKELTDARAQVAYIGQFCSVPEARIESLRFGSRDGPYVPFTLTLVEDR